MKQSSLHRKQDHQGTDRSALLMMLAYVEAECRRLGSVAAAQHAALAATLVQQPLDAGAPHRELACGACKPVH